MEIKKYSEEKNIQILIVLLKKYGVRKIIASPGATNVCFVGSVQSDPFFEIYSCADERSAAYMACGLAEESGEPVALSCTGATSSRNYLPALTEAFFRKLPVLAITSSQPNAKIGHLSPQLTDRSSPPPDTVNLSVQLPVVKDDEDEWECTVKVNRALLELRHRGGGPVHINLPTRYSRDFGVEELPDVRMIERIVPAGTFPELRGRVAVFAGSHSKMSSALTAAIDAFCAANNAVVFCDHTSGYKGKYRVLWSLATSQKKGFEESRPDVLIHIGEISGAYMGVTGTQVWRVSEDGELRDTFRKLRYVFEMPEETFFAHYATTGTQNNADSYLRSCREILERLRGKIPHDVLPFSNILAASRLAAFLPENSVLHLGILNSLRSWNMFEIPNSVDAYSNVGGFGIDGCVSSLIGASFANRKKLFFGVVGDLAFFYDMNSIGNRHVGNNLRLLLVNNGKGTEFRNFNHPCAAFGEAADEYMAAARHYGNKSPSLMRGYAESLGFEYLHAETVAEFEAAREHFLTPEMTERPMLFEIFTNDADESAALKMMMSIEVGAETVARNLAKKLLGDSGVKFAKKLLGR